MSASYTHTVREEDIQKYGEVSGDFNPVHFDEEYAKTTIFRGRIAHGMLSAGYISTVLGTKLPGAGAIFVNATLRFKAPVRIGDTVTATCTVREVNALKKRVILDCIARPAKPLSSKARRWSWCLRAAPEVFDADRASPPRWVRAAARRCGSAWKFRRRASGPPGADRRGRPDRRSNAGRRWRRWSSNPIRANSSAPTQHRSGSRRSAPKRGCWRRSASIR